MIIDSHQHFWNYNASRHAWIDDSMTAIRKDFMPNDLEPILKENNVDGCIAVQVDQTLDETKFLLDLSKKHDTIKGVVGWVDLLSVSVEDQLESFSSFEDLKGIRHIVQAEPEGFMLRNDFQNGIAKLSKYNLSYDVLVYPNQLSNAVQLISKFPNQVFILDHIAKPYIKERKIKNWEQHISELAKFPNVYCKISGMVTEANWNQWTYNDFVPYLDVVFNAFGTDRVLFGSDWPVCLLAAKYNEVKHIITKYIAAFSSEEQRQIMGGNTINAYSINN